MCAWAYGWMAHWQAVNRMCLTGFVIQSVTFLSHNMICTKGSMKGTVDRLIPSEKCVPVTQYYCSQRAPGSCRLHGRAQVHSPWASMKQRFLHYRPILMCLNHFPWVDIIWMGCSAICLWWLGLPEWEQRRSDWLLCPFVSHRSEVCCTNNTATAKTTTVIIWSRIAVIIQLQS